MIKISILFKIKLKFDILSWILSNKRIKLEIQEDKNFKGLNLVYGVATICIIIIPHVSLHVN